MHRLRLSQPESPGPPSWESSVQTEATVGGRQLHFCRSLAANSKGTCWIEATSPGLKNATAEPRLLQTSGEFRAVSVQTQHARWKAHQVGTLWCWVFPGSHHRHNQGWASTGSLGLAGRTGGSEKEDREGENLPSHPPTPPSSALKRARLPLPVSRGTTFPRVTPTATPQPVARGLLVLLRQGGRCRGTACTAPHPSRK